MSLTGEDGDRARFGMAGGDSGALVDVYAGVKDAGLQAGGTVHHVAFRAPDLATMTVWQQELINRGVSVTQILDRQYFKSIYFREPGGVLFEIATDAPGFDVDEPLLELGRHLKLPPWLEPDREQIAAALPPLAARRRRPVTDRLEAEPAARLPAGRRRSAPVRRCCCCTAPAATSTTCCRCGTSCRRARRCCRSAGPCWRTACRASSAGSARASSTRTTCDTRPTSSPSS